ncbi:MAG: hypothetical protein B1H11_01045 [Desulfobacteraceae bacterium 4484_190.1]|nr:MAG: hypothetical protein B1H11_01045 [Desulfobacteraceae bacterium 4484_190.1]
MSSYISISIIIYGYEFPFYVFFSISSQANFCAFRSNKPDLNPRACLEMLFRPRPLRKSRACKRMERCSLDLAGRYDKYNGKEREQINFPDHASKIPDIPGTCE